MNKKFSTLVASVLLAGGMFTTANAAIQNMVPGQYYRLAVGAASHNQNAYFLDSDADKWYVEAAKLDNDGSSWWTVEQVKDPVTKKVIAYKLVNKKGVYYTVKAGDNSYNAFAAQTSVNQVTITADLQLPSADQRSSYWALPVYGESLFAHEGDAKTDVVWGFDDVAIKTYAPTFGQLNDILGNGFGLQICKQVIKENGSIDTEKAPVEYTDLKGNVFTGLLHAEKGEKGVKLYQGAKEDDQQIVLTTEKWGTQGAGTTDDGYKFAVKTKSMKAEQILAEEFVVTVPGTVAGEPLEVVAVATGGTKYELIVTEIEGVTRLTVKSGELANDGKASFLYNKDTQKNQNTYVKFGLSNVADPTKVLTKNTFYTITEIAKDGEFVLAATGCNTAAPEFVEEAGNKLEAQWAISFVNGKYTIVNREEPKVKTTVAEGAVREDENTEDNVYVVYDKKGNARTVRIDAVETAENDGYMWLGDVKNQHFAMAHWSGVYNDKAWFTADSKGNVVLATGDVKEVATELVAAVKDTVEVESVYNYYDKKWITVKDTLKVPVYSFTDMEEAAFTRGTKDNYVFAANGTAEVLAIRENDGKYNLRLAEAGTNVKKNDGKFDYFLIDAGDSKSGMLELKHCIYDTNDGQLFVVEQMNRPIYRRLGATVEDNLKDMDVNTVKFHRANDANQFLYENTHNRNAASNGEFVLNFLGETNLADKPEKAELAIFVDTAYVRNNTMEPLYLLSVRNKFVEGKDAEPCNATDHQHMTADGKPTNDPNECFHAKKATPDYREGAYLVNLTDSVANVKEAKYQGNIRFAFVDAKHIGDSLIINNSEFTATKYAEKDTLSFVNAKGEQVENAATFSFRLVDPASEEGDFYIETVMKDGAHQYVRIHNTVPVLVSDLALAAKFNVNETTENATSNEEVAVSEVSVVAVDGAVVVKGAAGKTVAISNILGQTIANTVIASDNETIAVPAGIVVVAVEGEEAVKAIVR